MNFQHVNVKIFTEGNPVIDTGRMINIFHSWIQQKKDLGCLLIDVADYGHVPAGPGVMLIGLEADHSMDHAGNRWGLRYNRKAALDGSNADRFRQAFDAAKKACSMLEQEFINNGGLNFSRTEFEVFINDRAFAPNSPETLSAFRSELDSFLSGPLGQSGYKVETPADPRSRVGATVTLAKPFKS